MPPTRRPVLAHAIYGMLPLMVTLMRDGPHAMRPGPSPCHTRCISPPPPSRCGGHQVTTRRGDSAAGAPLSTVSALAGSDSADVSFTFAMAAVIDVCALPLPNESCLSTRR